MNAVLGAYTVQQGLTVQGEKRFGALYGVYLLQTRQIWAPELEGSDWFHLAAPPTDLEGFNATSHAVRPLRQDRLGAEWRNLLNSDKHLVVLRARGTEHDVFPAGCPPLGRRKTVRALEQSCYLASGR